MKRYEMTAEYNSVGCYDEVIPVESADGDWIKFKDYQAATEAAKATGTAGDLPELPQCFGSIDVYHDSGQVTSVDGWTADQMRGYAIDYAMQLGLAARQPAPVVAGPLTTENIACMGFDTFRILQGMEPHTYTAQQIAETILARRK